jgi:hypothetical protein
MFSTKSKLTLALLLPAFLISGCSTFNTEPRIQTVTEYVAPNILIQPRPKPVNMADVNFQVVTEENLDQFIEDFRKDYGEVVFIAMPVRDYERLAVNIQDIRRFINQQSQLIVYYETAISEASEATADKNNLQDNPE